MAKALSRLALQGQLERVSKGVYYRSRQTTFGKSLTQTSGWAEVATSGFTLRRKLLGSDTIIHTRRPDAWRGLREKDAALLDFLRRAGRTSELSPGETARRTLALSRERGRFARLLDVAGSEPPRVRAMLGAIGQELDKKPVALRRLRESLNPVSRFEFGMLRGLPHASGGTSRAARPARCSSSANR